MAQAQYRDRLREYIRVQANPPDKFSHQVRLYEVATSLAGGEPYDDDVLYAAVWLHDLGVFIGHRPEETAKLAAWDHVIYVMQKAPRLLQEFGFPEEKIPAVLETIRTHLPSAEPTSFEGTLMRDADILEQLGAVGILRTASKVGRDTRFVYFRDALKVLRGNLEKLPGQLRLVSARRAAEPRIQALNDFLMAAELERAGRE